MQDFHFANPEYTLLILLLPVLRLLFAYTNKSARSRLGRFVSEANLRQLLRSRGTFQGRSKIIFFWIGLVCLILALARPQANPSVEEMQSAGLDIYVLLDVSRSMDAEDVAPSRLKKAKRMIQNLAAHLNGDRIGIIAYANSAVLISPLTSDFSILESYLQSVDTSLVPSQGTNVANALEIAKEAMERGAKSNGEDSPRSNIFLVLSDGEDHGESDLGVADEIRKGGGLIFSIALGTEKGVPIPVRDDRGELRGYKKDATGEPVLTAVKPGVLRELSQKGGGQFYFSTVGETELEDILARVGDAQRGSFTSVSVVVFEEFFWIFLVPGILMVLFSFIPLSLLLPKNLLAQLRSKAGAPAVIVFGLFLAKSAHAGPISFFWNEERKASAQSQALAQQKKFAEAADTLKNLQAENPDSPELNYNIGTYLLQDQKGKMGREQLSHLRNADGPLRDFAAYNMAGSLAMEGKKEEARAAYAELIQRLSSKSRLGEDEATILAQAKRNVARLADPNQQPPPQKDKSDQQQQGGGGGGEGSPEDNKNKDTKSGDGQDQKNSPNQDKNEGKDKKENQDQSKDGKKEEKPGDQGQNKDENQKDQSKQDNDKEKEQDKAGDSKGEQKPNEQGQNQQPTRMGTQPFRERDNMGEDDAKRILGGLKERESNLQKKFLKNQVKGGRVNVDDAAKDW